MGHKSGNWRDSAASAEHELVGYMKHSLQQMAITIVVAVEVVLTVDFHCVRTFDGLEIQSPRVSCQQLRRVPGFCTTDCPECELSALYHEMAPFKPDRLSIESMPKTITNDTTHQLPDMPGYIRGVEWKRQSALCDFREGHLRHALGACFCNAACQFRFCL